MRRKELIEELNGVWEKLFMLYLRVSRRYKFTIWCVLQEVGRVIDELEEREMGVR